MSDCVRADPSEVERSVEVIIDGTVLVHLESVGWHWDCVSLVIRKPHSRNIVVEFLDVQSEVRKLV